MLVLSRGVGESIWIGGDILVTVVRVTPTEVRIGIEAPEGTVVYRNELGRSADGRPVADPKDPPPAST